MQRVASIEQTLEHCIEILGPHFKLTNVTVHKNDQRLRVEPATHVESNIAADQQGIQDLVAHVVGIMTTLDDYIITVGDGAFSLYIDPGAETYDIASDLANGLYAYVNIEWGAEIVEAEQERASDRMYLIIQETVGALAARYCTKEVPQPGSKGEVYAAMIYAQDDRDEDFRKLIHDKEAAQRIMQTLYMATKPVE